MKTCLVLMPFTEELKPRFEFIQGCGKAADLNVRRADTYTFSGNILTAIARAISQADLVVADLSKANANVAYELAIAQCMGQKVLLITDDRSAMPFDLLTYRCELVSQHSPEEAKRLAEAMRQALVATYVTGPLGGRAVVGQRVFFRRTLAFLLDAAMIVLVSIAAEASGAVFGLGSTAGAADGLPAWVVVAILLALLYFTLLTWRWGSTLGQRIADLKVVTFGGETPGFLQALGRTAATYVSVLTYGIGYLWCLRGPGYRTFHDIVSSTMVMRRKGKPRLAPV
jgi:uncharacterized RDD family membrane protein YckC